MKKLIVLAAAVLFPLSFCLGSALAVEAPKGPIEVTNYGKKAPVMFDHAKHKEVKCDVCHHMAKEGKYKCGDCHKAKKEGKIISLKDAAHERDVGKCWACHRAKDAVKKLGCSACHKG